MRSFVLKKTAFILNLQVGLCLCLFVFLYYFKCFVSLSNIIMVNKKDGVATDRWVGVA